MTIALPSIHFQQQGKMNNMSEESDSKLIAQAKEDPEAFGLLYERYVERIYNYIYYRTNNHHVAEDLTARTFYKTLQHISRYEDRGAPFSAYLYRIAHNLVANWHRDNSRRQIISLDSLKMTAGERSKPDRVTEKKGEQQRLLEAVRRLPADRQQLVILKHVEQMSNAEIGAVMGRTEGAIKSLYHRTLVALREELVDE
jgi:RNA polymerase sigma-70 factor, ECF subfamily